MVVRKTCIWKVCGENNSEDIDVNWPLTLTLGTDL